jgi:kojibiose phosphorylase
MSPKPQSQLAATPAPDPLASYLSPPPWLFIHEGYAAELEEPVESLLAVGNGYLCMRGILEENPKGTRPGTFIAGVFDKGNSQTAELVNAPNPIFLRVYSDGRLLEPVNEFTLENHRILDMYEGLLYRKTVFLDRQNRRFLVSSIRFVSLVDPHLIVLRYCINSLDEDASIEVEDRLDARVTNRDTIAREKNVHFRVLESFQNVHNYLLCQTINRKTHLLYATALQVDTGHAEADDRQLGGFENDVLRDTLTLPLKRNTPAMLTKWIQIHTSRHIDKEDLLERTRSCLGESIGLGFEHCLERHRLAWRRRWKYTDIHVAGDENTQKMLRFNLYHLMIAGPPKDKNASIGARTLTGEGYGGHVFWDTEIFVLPFFIVAKPAVARHLLMYRYRRLGAARQIAHEHGFQGAMFPWESADTGRDVTPTLGLDVDNNVVRLKTMDMEHHITGDIAYGCAMYVHWSGDEGFLLSYGAELMFETARFWASRVEYDQNKQRYVIRFVIGPDEFHENVDNNAYTNYLARWNLNTGARWHRRLARERPGALKKIGAKIGLLPDEPDRWETIADRLYLPLDEKNRRIEQFEGFFELEDFRIEERNGNYLPVFKAPLGLMHIQQIQAVKQADVVMLHALFPDAFDSEWTRNDYEYYEPRTTHSSSLSAAFHSIMAKRVGSPMLAWRYFLAALAFDFDLSNKNATDGIHAALAGGVWQAVVFGFAGVTLREDGVLSLSPSLPRHWEKLSFHLHCRGGIVHVGLTRDEVSMRLVSKPKKTAWTEANHLEVEIEGQRFTLEAKQPIRVFLSQG